MPWSAAWEVGTVGEPAGWGMRAGEEGGSVVTGRAQGGDILQPLVAADWHRDMTSQLTEYLSLDGDWSSGRTP